MKESVARPPTKWLPSGRIKRRHRRLTGRLGRTCFVAPDFVLFCTSFLLLLVVAQTVLAAVGTVTTGELGKRPNIVLFVSDDHGWYDSGVYGKAFVRDVARCTAGNQKPSQLAAAIARSTIICKTPHIDRLAKESMRFTHAFAASPLCSPSRCALETGLMPHRNGGHKFGTPIRGGIVTMPEYFKQLGYFTAHIGKFHHEPRARFPYDFVQHDEQNAAEFLRAYDKIQPLLLVVCTHPPHTPWVENRDYDPSQVLLPPNFIDTPETRADRVRYYSDVTLMDRILGDVLDAIAAKRMGDDTLFVYTSDQGANWPFAKWCVYDGGLRVPLIVRWPGKIAPGTVTAAMTCLVDLLPTFLDAAGAAVPGNIDGRSLLPVLTGQKQQHRDVVFGTHTGNDNGGPGVANHCPARTIRTARYRYIINLSPETTFTTHITGCKTGPHYLPHWDSWIKRAKNDSWAKVIVQRYQHRPAEELYDLQNDPFEMHNLANAPQQSSRIKVLRKQLARWCKQQGDDLGWQQLREGSSN